MKNEVMSLKDIKDEADPDVEVHALRRTINNLKAEIKAQQRDHGNLKAYFREIQDSIKAISIPPIPKIYKPPKNKTPLGVPCALVVHFSDWHYGAVQEPQEIEDINGFSPEILETRIRNFQIDILKWISTLRKGYLIEECVILDTGDNISGDIHRDLSVTNAFPTPVQSVKCGIFKGEIIAGFAPHFERTRVEFCVPDNHGRLTKKPQAKQEGLNSHNYVVGEVAKLICERTNNIDFNLHLSHNKIVTVSGRNYLLTHGHGVIGWASFPWYGVERKISREALARLWEPDFRKFHKVVAGHWHTPLTSPWYWFNGSASGTDALDHKQGRRSSPIQCAWIVHPNHGEFARTEFNLRDDNN